MDQNYHILTNMTIFIIIFLLSFNQHFLYFNQWEQVYGPDLLNLKFLRNKFLIFILCELT